MESINMQGPPDTTRATAQKHAPILYPLVVGALILVTGGTGFTGRALVQRLAALGFRVRMAVRQHSDVTWLPPGNIEVMRGDLHDKAFIDKAMLGVQYVMHMASSFRETYRSFQEQYNVHVASTQLLADAASRQPGFRRFIHVSTIGVHGHIEEPPADENYRFEPGDAYQQTKLEAEKWIRAYGRERGLPVTVVRPAGIYGPGDKRLLKLFKMAARPVVPLIGQGRCLFHLIHVEDLVDGFLTVAEHPAALQDVFICGDPAPVTLMDIVQTAGAVYGVRNRFIRIPVAPVMAAAVVCERLCVPLRIQPPIFPRRVGFFTKDRAFNTSKIRRVLGYESMHETIAGIQETARWYRANGWA